MSDMPQNDVPYTAYERALLRDAAEILRRSGGDTRNECGTSLYGELTRHADPIGIPGAGVSPAPGADKRRERSGQPLEPLLFEAEATVSLPGESGSASDCE